MRVIIDTCVMIDGLNDREQFAAHAQMILLAIERGYVEGCVTAKSLMDIYYVCRHETHSQAKTDQAISWVLQHMTIFDTFAEDCHQAFALNWRDFEDALMATTAKRCGADCIITRNIKDFEGSPLPVYTPEQFVQTLL